MRDVHSLPRWMGIFLIILGVVFFVPLLAMIHIFSIPDLWNQVIIATGWSYLMIGWVFACCTIVAILLGYGAEIIYYSDKKSELKDQKDYKDWKSRDSRPSE